jgi:hypothetical protein
MQVSSEFRNRTARDLSGNLKYENAEAIKLLKRIKNIN